MTNGAQPGSVGGPEYGFLAPATVYFDDLDSFGMLYNSHYGVLVERAWVGYWQQRGVAYAKDWSQLDDSFNVVKEYRVTYEVPINRPGEYGIHIWSERLGNTALTYGFRVCTADGTQTYAHGIRTIVRLDRTTLRPTGWSEQARALMDGLTRPE
jgi:acyl-CoA thioester hydrolase